MSTGAARNSFVWRSCAKTSAATCCQLGCGRRPRSAKGQRHDCIWSNAGKKNVRVSRASCVEWSDARESVFMVCGRHPRRVLKLRSRKTDAVRKLSIHHSHLLFTSQTHVCSDTGAAYDQRRHTPGCSDGICANTQELITSFASATPELLRQRLEVGVQY